MSSRCVVSKDPHLSPASFIARSAATLYSSSAVCTLSSVFLTTALRLATSFFMLLLALSNSLASIGCAAALVNGVSISPCCVCCVCCVCCAWPSGAFGLGALVLPFNDFLLGGGLDAGAAPGSAMFVPAPMMLPTKPSIAAARPVPSPAGLP